MLDFFSEIRRWIVVAPASPSGGSGGGSGARAEGNGGGEAAESSPSAPSIVDLWAMQRLGLECSRVLGVWVAEDPESLPQRFLEVLPVLLALDAGAEVSWVRSCCWCAFRRKERQGEGARRKNLLKKIVPALFSYPDDLRVSCCARQVLVYFSLSLNQPSMPLRPGAIAATSRPAIIPCTSFLPVPTEGSRLGRRGERRRLRRRRLGRRHHCGHSADARGVPWGRSIHARRRQWPG